MLKSAIVMVSTLFVLGASALPPGITVDPAGRMNICGMSGDVTVYDRNWRRISQNSANITPEPGYPVPSEKIYELKGTLRIPGTKGFVIQQWVKEENSHTATYSMSMKNQEGISCNTAAWSLELPVHQFDGKEMMVNGKSFKIKGSQPVYCVKELVLFSSGRKITLKGNFTVQIQDNRSWQVPSFSLRLLFSQSSGVIKETKMDFSITVDSLALSSLDFNRASDGKVTGKGLAENLRGHGTEGGELTFGSIRFQLGNAKKKTGTILDLEGKTTAVVPAGKNSGNMLYLLHTSDDSTAKPVVSVRYADGGKKEFTLADGRDFSTKRPLMRLPNGALATAENNSFRGFYFSAFPLEKKNVKDVEFRNDGSGKWLVAAAVLAENSVKPENVESICFVTEGKEWAPMEQYKPVVKGSILDFTFFQDAPAGKYGWITTDENGHFNAEKAKEKRFKFFGPNLCFSAQYLDKASAERLADELALLGYTVVRFHHYDNALSDPKSKSSTVLQKEKLDQLDYLFACLKKRGIYMTLDLYCSRILRKNELPGISSGKGYALKSLLPIYPPARENWKTFVRNLLTHKNPYTGLTWGADPALFSVSLSNENSTLYNWRGERKELYLAGYKAYLEKHSLLNEKNLNARDGLFFRYLAELNIEMIRDLSGFLRKEIGYKGLVTEINFQQNAALAEIRDSLDFVDNHQYWDHPNSLPKHAWSFPYLHNQMSALKSAAWNPRTIMPSRIFGKPFTATELNYVFPNRHRAESGPILGAYAALQDWDGLYRFAWAHNDSEVRHEREINTFDIAEDTLSHAAERITILMFLRGDVKRASSGVAWPFGNSTFQELAALGDSNFPVNFEMLGFYCRIGSLRETKTFPDVKRLKSTRNFMDELSPAEVNAIRNPVKKSETGEIVYDTGKGTLKVVSPKTESLSFFDGALSGSVLNTSRGTRTFQVVTASAMDGAVLKNSKKILLFHQTDVTNKYIRYSSENQKAVEDWGRREPLIRRGSVQIELKLASGKYKVQAIGLDGVPKGTVSSNSENGSLLFTADTASFGGTMIYLIEKQ